MVETTSLDFLKTGPYSDAIEQSFLKIQEAYKKKIKSSEEREKVEGGLDWIFHADIGALLCGDEEKYDGYDMYETVCRLLRCAMYSVIARQFIKKQVERLEDPHGIFFVVKLFSMDNGITAIEFLTSYLEERYYACSAFNDAAHMEKACQYTSKQEALRIARKMRGGSFKKPGEASYKVVRADALLKMKF